MQPSVYLLLGTNQGNRQRNLQTAIELLSDRLGKIQRTSAIYETAAWGEKDQPAFLNQVVQLESAQAPPAMLETIKGIEQEVGRTATYRWGPREIDIDILVWGDQVYTTDTLQIPHRELPNRRFALAPLCELAAQEMHPQLSKSYENLLLECKDELEVKKWKQA